MFQSVAVVMGSTYFIFIYEGKAALKDSISQTQKSPQGLRHAGFSYFTGLIW
ncbi:hypothetical protein SGP15_18820 [Brenneria sp. L4-2C]|uniref:hypothetical protein n=1 Tax=Brenneria sp. L4-2C TaxID=3094863 RepID=UPI0029C58652|nr:hypothetical protein [Brenneria sp. L4-2C]MDX5629987.1 hypothetical protein [Brenneria sp. L3-3Z]MDX5629995.1 hypothetical protein [Brenneria sp. L3-3Z]MDX5697133.1 hypothetical protein [Brenneria sp. L4-2C]MDX5697141.1 hypothetical protein [Brenneria sp. L4-2C]